jgi:hypothetical protein
MARFNIRKWEFDGRKLADPITLVRRLIALPFLWPARIVYFVVVLVGWGWHDAVDAWERMP